MGQSSIKQLWPPFDHPNEGFSIVFTLIQQPPKIKYMWVNFVLDKMMTDKSPK